jgi:hypothetical protein
VLRPAPNLRLPIVQTVRSNSRLAITAFS